MFGTAFHLSNPHRPKNIEAVKVAGCGAVVGVALIASKLFDLPWVDNLNKRTLYPLGTLCSAACLSVAAAWLYTHQMPNDILDREFDFSPLAPKPLADIQVGYKNILEADSKNVDTWNFVINQNLGTIDSYKDPLPTLPLDVDSFLPTSSNLSVIRWAAHEPTTSCFEALFTKYERAANLLLLKYEACGWGKREIQAALLKSSHDSHIFGRFRELYTLARTFAYREGDQRHHDEEYEKEADTTFYTEGSVQHRWRSRYNDFCRRWKSHCEGNSTLERMIQPDIRSSFDTLSG